MWVLLVARNAQDALHQTNQRARIHTVYLMLCSESAETEVSMIES